MSDVVQQLSESEQEEDTPEDGGSKLTVSARYMRLSSCLSSDHSAVMFLGHYIVAHTCFVATMVLGH